jgi:fatty-acyl-CoA synthase
MADWYEKTPIGALVDRAARLFGPKEALSFGGCRWTFAQLKEDVDRTAKGLIGLGVQPGEKVALWMPNRPEWIHTLFAVAQVGAVLVPVNTRFRTADLDYVVRQSDTATLITVDRSGPVDYLSMVRELCPELEDGGLDNLRPERFPELKRVIVAGDTRYPGVTGWDRLMDAGGQVTESELASRHRSVDPDGPSLIMYTSGTTGFPKGVVHCHNIQRNVSDEANRMGMTSRDVILMYLPLFHAFGLYEGPLMSTLTGARMVLTTLYQPAEALKLIKQERVTVLHGFDTHFHGLVSHPDCEGTDRSSLRTGILAVGMASSEAVARRSQNALCPTITGWGMTEVGVAASMSFLDSSEDDRCAGSGFPLPGYEFKVIDPETGKDLPAGAMGELCVRTYAMMLGYYKKPEETALAVDAEGWLHTGDVASIRDDGFVYFTGRYKELLKVGGENVDPVEVEAFLLDHPAVSEAQIIGIPDDRLGEVACACVILKDGEAEDREGLLEFCRGRLASFKLPRYVLFMSEYPMTPSGKVQKFRLRELAQEALNSPVTSPERG